MVALNLTIQEIIRMLVSKFRNDGYYSIGAYTKPIGVLYGFEYIPIIKDENFNQIKNKIEILYNIYDFDIIILGIVINKKNINCKEVNICLKPNITIFLVDFAQKINEYLKLNNMIDTSIITSQNKNNTENYFYFVYIGFSVRKLSYLE